MRKYLFTSAIVLMASAGVLPAHAQQAQQNTAAVQAIDGTAEAPPVASPSMPAPSAPADNAAAQSPTASATPGQTAPAAPATPNAPMADGTLVAAVPPADQMDALNFQPTTAIEKEISDQLSFQKPSVDPNRMTSLFFNRWEHDLIVDARRGLVTRSPEMMDDGVQGTGPRDVALSGIVYHGPKEWVVWINDMRVAPTAIPDQVLDLKVYKDYIELEWFDDTTNQIYPIRLRSHQRFNLDTRMFLPG